MLPSKISDRVPFETRPTCTGRSWQDNLALTTDRVLAYRTGRVGVCLIAAMIYIALISVELFVPDWTVENKAEADANLAKDIYYNDDDEVLISFSYSTFHGLLFVWNAGCRCDGLTLA